MSIEYRVLGPLSASVDGVEVRLGGPRQRAVLAALLLRVGQVVPTTRIIDDVWGTDVPDSAGNLVQGYVSGLRKELGRASIETHDPGYVLRLGRELLDLKQFQQLANEGSAALEDLDCATAVARLSDALSLWRGPALADLPDDSPVRWQAAHLDDLRQAATERLVEAHLASGHADEALALARPLVAENPTDEKPLALLMTALYRAGRQSEALDAFHAGRSTLIDQLGLEPSETLVQLQRAILEHDVSLPGQGTMRSTTQARAPRIVVLVAFDGEAIEPALNIVRVLTSASDTGPWEVVVAVTTPEVGELTALSQRLAIVQESWGVATTPLRTACFTSMTPGRDLARIATEQDASLIIVTAPSHILEDERLTRILEHAPSDVAIVVDGRRAAGPVMVPFAGGPNDWAAVELGALLARARNSSLELLGVLDPDGTDGSRLLASASLAVQRALNVTAEPRLSEPGTKAIADAARGSSMVIVGLTDRWMRDGLGAVRTALATSDEYPTVLVRRGTRPGILANPDSHTRFTWTSQ